MKAVILAGGKGTRLHPYTTFLPKPLMPLGNMPVLDVVLRQLASCGFTDITLAVGHLAELIMAYCGEGQKYGIKLSYSREDSPLGTAGPLALVRDLHDPFLVMNGDILTSLDYAALWRFHQERKAIATVAVHHRDVKIDYGVIHCDQDDWVTNYIEKPVLSYRVSMGIYIFEPSVLQYISEGQRLDLPDLVLQLRDRGLRIASYPHQGHWLDIGRPDDYASAVEEFEAHRQRFLRDI